jgi:H2-forming N5,N10-methylenetetrahydromethanopterin dehydrogenase-like enzyme
MTRTISTVFIIFAALTLSACSLFYGNMESARKAIDLAIDCQTDDALKTADQTEKGGGIAGIMANHEREAILRDVGRIQEAEALKAARDSRTDIDQKTKADAEKTVLELVDNIRKERAKKIGNSACKP